VVILVKISIDTKEQATLLLWHWAI